MKLPELLAPVGTWEALVAAVENGADAVYLGGKMFSARQYANNFDHDELIRAVEFAHIRGVRVFITANTLVTQDELPEALNYLKFLYEIGVDAVILQDLGVVRLARELLPELELHASTQMSIHNAAGAQLLVDNGFKRVVLARENSLRDIEAIRSQVPVELEVFIHGALCFSYSGQCLMSSLIGGRSGNRGRCAQPCRLKYDLVDPKGRPAEQNIPGQHLISPKDLWMLHHLPDLARAGVASLKIEGRMKRPEYVATVVRVYRQALDRYAENPASYEVAEREEKDIRQIFNRDFTTGYFYGNPGAGLISYARPNNRGLKLGRILDYNFKTKEARLLLEEDLHVGDGLEIWVSQGGRAGIVVPRLKVRDKQVEEAKAGETVTLEIPGKIRPGDRVFKTLDSKLTAKARESYTSSKEQRKFPLRIHIEAEVGKPLSVTMTDPAGVLVTAETVFIAEEAQKRPLDMDTLYRQMDRLGNTPFAIGDFSVNLDGQVMVPISEINEVRRKAVELLMAERAKVFAKEPTQIMNFTSSLAGLMSEPVQRNISLDQVRLSVAVGDLAAMEAAVKAGADVVYFGSERFTARTTLTGKEITQAREICGHKSTLVFTTPRILEQEKIEGYQPILEKLVQAEADGLMAANLGFLKLIHQKDVENIYGDFPLNIFNAQAIDFLASLGCKQITLSPELTLRQVGEIGQLAKIPVETLVHGSLPMMVSQHCIVGSCVRTKATDKGCSGACGTFKGGLKDRLNMVFPVVCDEYCHQYIFNPKELCMIEDLSALIEAGVTNLRIEAKKESADYVKKVVIIYRRELDRYLNNPAHYRSNEEAKEQLSKLSPAGLTKGHYYRGVV